MRRKPVEVSVEAEKPKTKKIVAMEGPVFNEYNKELIYEFMRRGMHYTTAVALAGISKRTAQQWRENGERDLVDFEDGVMDCQSEWAVFYSETERARASFLMGCTNQLVESGKDPQQWGAVKFLIQGHDNDNYGPKQRVDVNQNTTKRIIFEIASEKEWKKEPDLPQITDENLMEGEYIAEDIDGIME